MEFFLVRNTQTKMTGVPVYLNASLHEQWIAGGRDTPMRYDWVCRIDALPSRGAPLSFPDELWLISKDRKYDFDLYLAHAGMLASRQFLDVLDAQDKENFKIAKVHAVDQKGKNISTKELFYIKFNKIIYGVDRNRTKFIQKKLGDDLIFSRNDQPAITYVRELYIDEKRVEKFNLFEMHDLNGNHTFITETLRKKMIDAGMRGVDLIPIDRYVEAEQWKVRDIEREYGLPIDQIPDATSS